jgi:hypothetical protein
VNSVYARWIQTITAVAFSAYFTQDEGLKTGSMLRNLHKKES